MTGEIFIETIPRAEEKYLYAMTDFDQKLEEK